MPRLLFLVKITLRLAFGISLKNIKKEKKVRLSKLAFNRLQCFAVPLFIHSVAKALSYKSNAQSVYHINMI